MERRIRPGLIMIETKPPQKKELREFGYMMAGVLSVLFGFLLPYLFDHQAGDYSWEFHGFSGPFWPLIVASIFLIFALLIPVALGPIYKLWMRIGDTLGWINTRIILGVVFYVVVFPIGVLLKIFGKDPMRRKQDATAQSYRIKSEQPEQNHIERPY